MEIDLDGYDLIGDVHGCADTLITLLETLGYESHQGVYCHPSRKAIFLGDIIDRGPGIRHAVTLVRRMVDAGQALIVMGNHEYNALVYCTKAPAGSQHPWLRAHSARHTRILQATLEQYRDYPDEWQSTLDWFMTLPLCLELDSLRVVHACWDHALIETMLARLPDARMDKAYLIESSIVGSQAHETVDRLTRGIQLPLPDGYLMTADGGFTRDHFRAHFWCPDPKVLGDVVYQPDSLPDGVDDSPLSAQDLARLRYYSHQEPPLFIGHYWCEGQPELPASNIACLDYSAVNGGRLVAYRWHGEASLNQDHLVWVEAAPATPKGAKNDLADR